MARYEVTTILPEESTQNPAISLIETLGGTILNEEALGKRRFAYPINKLTSGAYDRVRFEAEPAMIPQLDEKLRQDHSLIRYLIVSQPHEVAVAAPEVDEAAIAALGDANEMTKAAEATAKTAKTAETAPATAPAEPVAKTPAPTAEPAEDVTVTAESGKNESVVDEATRQASLDETLKNILGK